MGWFKKREKWMKGRLGRPGWYWIQPCEFGPVFIGRYQFVDGKPVMSVDKDFEYLLTTPQNEWRFVGPLSAPVS